MGECFSIRQATVDDVDGIYNVFCSVQLRGEGLDDPEKGFLLSDYKNNPGFYKQQIEDLIEEYIVCEEQFSGIVAAFRGGVLDNPDFNNGWKGSPYEWDTEMLEGLGIIDVDAVGPVGRYYTTAVHPEFRGRRIAGKMKRFFLQSDEMRIAEYVVSTIVEEIFVEGLPQSMKNMASIGSNSKLGAVKIGQSSRYRCTKTVFGDNVELIVGLYITPVNGLRE
ncbi:hypothetical protein JXC34_02360 [Candidatus Woesearchaeota archaeon]|nr:hypothetical protein [Candidatus Woesearchaeota archaeon]